MATLDIFNNDAFSLSRLTQTIVDIPAFRLRSVTRVCSPNMASIP